MKLLRSRRTRILMGLVVGVVVLIPIALAAFYLWIFGEEVIEKRGQSGTVMAGESGVGFTAECRDIDYWFSAEGMQNATMFSKFTCDRGDLNAVTNALILSDDHRLTAPRTRTRIDAPKAIPVKVDDWRKKPSWWDLNPARLESAILCEDIPSLQIWIGPRNSSECLVYLYLHQ